MRGHTSTAGVLGPEPTICPARFLAGAIRIRFASHASLLHLNLPNHSLQTENCRFGAGFAPNMGGEHFVHWVSEDFTSAERERWPRVCRFVHGLLGKIAVRHGDFSVLPETAEHLFEVQAKGEMGKMEEDRRGIFPKDFSKFHLCWYDDHDVFPAITYFIAVMFPGRLGWEFDDYR